MIWTNVLQRCTVLVPTMDSTKLLMIWGQGIMSYSVNGIPCVDCKFSTRLNDCGWLEWIVGLMVHFLICDDIYIGKFDRVFFYEVARLWRWCFSYMIILFMAVGLPWIVDQYKWSARPSQYDSCQLATHVKTAIQVTIDSFDKKLWLCFSSKTGLQSQSY